MSTATLRYDPQLENAIADIRASLRGRYVLSTRSIALMLLAGDEEIRAVVAQEDPQALSTIDQVIGRLSLDRGGSLVYQIYNRQRAHAQAFLQGVIQPPSERHIGWLDRILIEP